MRFARGGFRLQRRGRDELAALRQHDDFLAKLTERQHNGLAAFGLGRGALRRVPDQRGDALHLFLDLTGETLRIARAFLRRLREPPHFVGNHREAPAMIAGAGCLDGGVQGQKVGLIRDMADRLGDIADAGGLFAELFHDGDGRCLTLAVRLDVVRPCADFVRSVGNQLLQRIGSAPPCRGTVTGLSERCRGAVGGGECFLRSGSRLLGSGCDLLHRPAEFFGSRSGLRDPAGKLVARCADTLFDFLIAVSR